MGTSSFFLTHIANNIYKGFSNILFLFIHLHFFIYLLSTHFENAMSTSAVDTVKMKCAGYSKAVPLAPSTGRLLYLHTTSVEN